MRSKTYAWLMAVLILACVVTLAGIGNGWFVRQQGLAPRHDRHEALQPAINQTPRRDPDVPPGPGMIKVGGIWRPVADIEAPLRDTVEPLGQALKSAGSTPTVDPNENASTQIVAKALQVAQQEPPFGDERSRVKKHLSVMHQADPFDREEFLRDPETYLNDIQPGRIWQSLPEGADVKPIQRIGSFFRRMVQGESAQLQTIAEPGLPVTFYSANLGQFENRLTTITVRADEKGIATVTYTATPGTRGDISIVAASPVNSQQAKFTINVTVPQKAPPDAGATGTGE